MTDPFVAEIRIFAGNFAPKGWALCNGQLMPISQNTALFSLIGTYYGGDGRSTFALPNLQGSMPIEQGQGPGLSPRSVGESGGTTTVTLLPSEMPAHTHGLAATTAAGDSSVPTGRTWGEIRFGRQSAQVYSGVAPNTTMAPTAVDPAGGGQPHNNMPPYLVLNFIIALQGIFPPRA